MDSKNIAIIALAVMFIGSIGANVYFITLPPPKPPEEVEEPKINLVDTETLIVATYYPNIRAFEPALGFSGWAVSVIPNIYDNLLTFEGSETMIPTPELAESWEISEDGMVYTFHLRKGVLFTSGNELTAEDVVWSFDRCITILGPPSFFPTMLGLEVGSTVALDRYTVQLTLGMPFAKTIVYQCLANPVSGILDKKVVMEHEVEGDFGRDWVRAEHSEGCGPYMIDAWEEGVKLVLVYNPTYWKWYGETKIREPPVIKKCIWLAIEEASTQLMMIQKGDIDIAVDLSIEQLADIKKKEGFRIVKTISVGYRQLNMMVRETYKGEPNPLADNRVRQAIKFSIDYEGIVNELFGGLYEEIQTLLLPNMPGYIDYKPYNRNITKAKELLAEAGYPEGIDLDMVVRPRRERQMMAPKLQADLADAGIRCELTQLPDPEWRALVRDVARDWQLSVGGLGLDYPEPDAAIGTYAYCRSLGEDDPMRMQSWQCGWLRPDIADMIDEARAMPNWEDRKPIYEQIQRIWTDEGPIAMILWKPYRHLTIRTWVEGVTPGPMWYFKIENAYKDPGIIQ